MMNKIPPITRNLILINVVCFLIQEVLRMRGIDVTTWLGLHFALASQFNVFQLVTYMFCMAVGPICSLICFHYGCLAA